MADELDHLRNLGSGLVEPDEDDVRRARELLEQRIGGANGARARGPRLRRRWSVAIASALVLVGSALGFGLGSSLTPSGAAGTMFAGFGFLPASGWTVVQSGTIDARGAATATAATVPLHRGDAVGELPRSTIRSLPPRGVLIHASFETRGDAGEDARFDVRSLPLDVENATPVAGDSGEYRLRAGIGGYNVEARIFFGTGPPSAQMLAEAQLQLSRLVVQSERVTITARPTVATATRNVELFGSVEGAREGDGIAIQAKDCGKSFFRVVAGTTTRNDGAWSIPFNPYITTAVRAVWNDVASRQVTVRSRAPVTFRETPFAGRYEVSVVGRKSFWRKRVTIERFDPRLGTWSALRSVVLTESGGTGGGGFAYARTEFALRVPNGTRLRAVVPLSQARPCYLAGTSPPIRA